jgi:signal transduction histidine kinase
MNGLVALPRLFLFLFLICTVIFFSGLGYLHSHLNDSPEALAEARPYMNASIAGIIVIFVGIKLVAFWLYFKLRKKNRLLQENHELLNDQHAKLNQVMTDKRQLVSLLAHEIRSPLTLTRLNVHSLIDSKALSTDEKADLKEVEEAAGRMEDLIHKIIEIENMDDAPYDFEEMQLNEVAETALAEYSGLSREKKLLTLLNVDPDRCYKVFGNPFLIKKVVNNLISNAIKFSPPGETVFVTLFKQNGHTGISVRDRGIGLSEKEQKLIFEKYYHQQDELAAKQNSLGLGLYLAKWYVEKHHGQIKVNSAPGKGAEFVVLLPSINSQ